MHENNISRRSFLKGAFAGGASLAVAGVLGAPAFAETSGIYTPGTYSAEADGIGRVIVTMTFSADAITDVVLDVSHETPTIGGAAAEELRAAVLAAQSGEIDAVAGASITSSAVSKAAAKCIQQAKGEIPVEVIAPDEETAEGNWLGVEPEIAEGDIKQEIETEVLVVGCGTGGMFTIASAAESGAKVIGIDRFAMGTGVRNDIAAIDSRYQKEWGTKIDKFDFITMATQYAAGRISQDLVKLFCDKSGKVVDWYGDRLADRGVEFWHESGDSNDQSRYEHFATGHSARFAGSDDGNGKELDGNKVLYDYALSKGAEFHFNTRMVKLCHEKGKVTGCIAKNENGEYIRYTASKGTVVCTGGYAHNDEMMVDLQPFTVRIVGKNESLPGACGDGIKACLWAGAGMDETHSAMLFDRCVIRPEQETGLATQKSGDVGGFWMGSQPWLKVNADGVRFFNESGTYEGILHADENQKGHCHYTIFDANWTTYMPQFLTHGCSRMYPFENGADPNIPMAVMENVMLPPLIENGFVKQADSIEELAELLKLPVKEFTATVEHYNEMVKAGEDSDYGKEAFRMSAVDTAPFYGAKNTGCLLCSMDGIKINTKLQALDTNCEVIEGLYVVGNDSGGYFANTYPNLATGMACGRTITFGYTVGKLLAGEDF